MKIVDLKVLRANRSVFCQIYTDEGIVGLGESGAWVCSLGRCRAQRGPAQCSVDVCGLHRFMEAALLLSV